MCNNDILIIRGHAGTYKSSLAQILVNTINDRKCCYIDVEDNKDFNLNNNISVYQESIKDFSTIETIINDNDVVVIDYISLLNFYISDDDLLNKLCKIVKGNNKTLILVECISSQRDIMLDERNKELKTKADLIITLDRNV